jgi:hypothetical protein
MTRRVRYSPEGKRVLCTKPVYGFPPDDPGRIGTILREVTPNVVEVLWDDRRSVQMLHRDYLETFTDPATSSPAGNSGGCSANPSTPEGVGM